MGIFLCLLTIPSLEAAPQFRGLLRSFFNFNGFPVLDPNEAEQNKKFPTIFSNGLNEVSQATQPVRFQSGRVPTTTRARPTVTTTRIKITKTTAAVAPVTTTTTLKTTTSTAAPTTTVTTTKAPTTRAPTTRAPTTRAPTTTVPTTKAPTTTTAPTTAAPKTKAPTTTTKTTEAPTTEAPATEASSSEVPTTKASTSQAPTTTTLPLTILAITDMAARGKLVEIIPPEIEVEGDELVEQLLEQTSDDNSVLPVMKSEKLLEMALTRLKQMEEELNK